MNIDDIKQATVDAKARAFEMASGYIKKAKGNAPTERDFIVAETAAQILANAETRSGLLPREFQDKQLRAASEGLSDAAAPSIEAAAAAQSEAAVFAALEEVAASMNASLDARLEAFQVSLEEHSMKSWLKACDDLLTLDRPLHALAPVSDAKQ